MKELMSAYEKQVMKIHRSNLQDNAKKTLRAGWQVGTQ
jgi:hypothetical protein